MFTNTITETSIYSVASISEMLINREIDYAVINNGGKEEKKRLFISSIDLLCYFGKNCKRLGYVFTEEMAMRVVRVGKKTQGDLDIQNFKLIQKYRKQAEKATHTNNFIKQCLSLPKTFEQWVSEGKKGLYDSGITTGNRIDGQLISIKSIAEKIYNGQEFINAVQNKKDFTSRRFGFNGYEGSIELKTFEDGEFQGWFSKEFKNCGNGYYYLLINDKFFIGYDVD